MVNFTLFAIFHTFDSIYLYLLYLLGVIDRVIKDNIILKMFIIVHKYENF